LNIPEHFLTNSPDTWDSDNDYIDGQRKVRSSKDVNDAAEWGEAMIQAFSGVKSRGTEAGFYSEDFPNPNMSTFTAVGKRLLP